MDVAKARRRYSFLKDEPDLLLMGFNISLSKRTNLSFAHDYLDMGISHEDKQIATYLKLGKNIVDLIREMTAWSENIRRNTGSKPELHKHELWQSFKEARNKRAEIARLIVQNYDDYKNRLIQLNINFNTITAHAKLENQQIREQESSLYKKSSNYQNVIKNIKLQNTTKFKRSYARLQKEITKNTNKLIESEEKLNSLELEHLNLKQLIANEQIYKEKLLPEYLKRTYKKNPEQIIRRWRYLTMKYGKEKAMRIVNRSPQKLGKLQGVGIGKWLALNGKRIDAIAGSKLIGHNLEHYSNSRKVQSDLKQRLNNINYEKNKATLNQEIRQLKPLLPARIDEEFFDQVNSLIVEKELKVQVTKTATEDHSIAKDKIAKIRITKQDLQKLSKSREFLNAQFNQSKQNKQLKHNNQQKQNRQSKQNRQNKHINIKENENHTQNDKDNPLKDNPFKDNLLKNTSPKQTTVKQQKDTKKIIAVAEQNQKLPRQFTVTAQNKSLHKPTINTDMAISTDTTIGDNNLPALNAKKADHLSNHNAIEQNNLKQNIPKQEAKSGNSKKSGNYKNNYNKFVNLPKLSFAEVNRSINSSITGQIFETYARSINPDGKIMTQGSNISCGSLNMNLKNGLWTRFSDESKGDIYHFIQSATGCSKYQSLEHVANIAGISPNIDKDYNANHNTNYNYKVKSAKTFEKNKITIADGKLLEQTTLHNKPVDEWIAYNHVPETATRFNPNYHIKFLKQDNNIQTVHPYYNSHNKLLGYTVRIAGKEDGKKSVMPITYCKNEAKNMSGWRLKAFTDDSYKPIYGIEKLEVDNKGNNSNQHKMILLVEGEKTADRAAKIFPEYAVLSWLGGSKAADKVNWSKLKDRGVVIWPDNDEAGIKAARVIELELNKVNGHIGMVSTIDTTKLNLAKGWDLADKLPKHLDHGQIKQLVRDSRLAYLDVSRILGNIPQKATKREQLQFWQSLAAGVTDINAQRQMPVNQGQTPVNNKLLENKSTTAINDANRQVTIENNSREQQKWQKYLTGKEVKDYEKYSTIRGKGGSDHEFLKLHDRLYSGILSVLAVNNGMKVDDIARGKILISQIPKLQELYHQKLSAESINMNQTIEEHQLHTDNEKYLENISKKHGFDMVRFYRQIIKDFNLLHKQQLNMGIGIDKLDMNTLPVAYQQKLTRLILSEIEQELKIKHNNIIEFKHHQAKITSRVYDVVNKVSWWQSLAKEQIKNAIAKSLPQQYQRQYKQHQQQQTRIIDEAAKIKNEFLQQKSIINNTITLEIKHLHKYGSIKRDGKIFTAQTNYLKHIGKNQIIVGFLSAELKKQINAAKQVKTLMNRTNSVTKKSDNNKEITM